MRNQREDSKNCEDVLKNSLKIITTFDAFIPPLTAFIPYCSSSLAFTDGISNKIRQDSMRGLILREPLRRKIKEMFLELSFRFEPLQRRHRKQTLNSKSKKWNQPF
jgi:hypothetical protein